MEERGISMRKVDNSKRDQEIVKMHKEGKSKEEIAKHFNLSGTRIYNLLKNECGEKKEKKEEQIKTTSVVPVSTDEPEFGKPIICNYCGNKTDSFRFKKHEDKVLVACSSCTNLGRVKI